MAAGELADALKVPPNTMSFHLKELSNAGLISAERLGRSLVYSLRPERIRNLLNYLTEDCCQGRPDLCGTGFDCC